MKIFDLPEFKKGQKSTLLDTDNAEIVRKFMNAFENIKISRGEKDEVKISEQNVVISLRATVDTEGVDPKPLQASTKRPVGTLDPPAGLYVWMWLGLCGEMIPSNINEAILIPNDGDGIYFIYLKVKSTLKSCTIECSKTKPTQLKPDPITGAPPEFLYHILTLVTITNGGVTNINNVGEGSVGIYTYADSYKTIAASAGDPNAVPPILPKDAGTYSLTQFVFFR